MPSRQLAAIMFLDIEGYTAMMQRSEAEGLARVNRFSQVLKQQASQHHGDVLEFRGDGSLCTFPSAVDALACAQEIQLAFAKDPVVPVRIGIHLGDIVKAEDNIYGDGVNIASRIESMGVSGSVLVSEQFIPYLKSHPEFQLRTLGKFHFKNVEEPIEVFALANEGLRVPKRSEVRGKFQKKKRNLALPIALVGVILAGFFLWNLMGKEKGEAPSDPSEKRVSVLTFDNQTMDPNLDALGRLISDHLSKGFLETGETKVLSAQNIQPQVQLAGLNSLENPELTKKLEQSTGVNTLVGGTYYRIGEDSLMANAKVFDSQKGELIKVFDVRGSTNNLIPMVEEICQKVLGFWSVKGFKRFDRDPPRYAAFQEYSRAIPIYITDPDQSISHLKRAIELDPNFLEAQFFLCNMYNSEGNYHKKQELLKNLATKRLSFSKWENLRFEQILASENNNWLELARISEQMFLLDPSDKNAINAAISGYLQANYPQRALDIFSKLDKRFDPSGDLKITWTQVQEIFTHYQLDNYEKVAKIAEAYSLPLIPDAQSVMHSQALVYMGDLATLADAVAFYEERGTVNTSGKPTSHGLYLIMLCEALLLTEQSEGLKVYAQQLQDFAFTHLDDPSSDRDLGYSYFYRQDYQEAINTWQEEQAVPEGWPKLGMVAISP